MVFHEGWRGGGNCATRQQLVLTGLRVTNPITAVVLRHCQPAMLFMGCIVGKTESQLALESHSGGC